MIFRNLCATAALILIAMPALAQTAPPDVPKIDPRIIDEMLAVMDAMIKLREKQAIIAVQDATKREHDWAEYSWSLWEQPKVSRLESNGPGTFGTTTVTGMPPEPPAADATK